MNPKKINRKVNKIVNKYTVLLKYLTLGPAALKKSEIKMLIKEGLLDPKYYQPTIGDLYLESHIDLLSDASRKSVRNSAVKYLREHAGQFIDKFAERASTDLGTIINQNLLVHNRQLKTATRKELTAGLLTKQTAKRIAQNLRNKTQDLYKDWERIVNTEMAQAQNLGAVDAIIENNKSKAQDEIYVYKSGPLDDRKCKYCRKFWFLPDGTPKVYKLSELAANGTNYGKKAANWKPTIEISHPNCREVLLEIPKGWGFVGGSLTYISEDHNEYKEQRGL